MAVLPDDPERKNAQDLYRELVAGEAAARGLTVEQVESEAVTSGVVPAVRREISAEEAPAATGQEDWLDAHYEYPTPDCFTPFELEQLTTADLTEEKLAHLNRCAPCAGLAGALVPSQSRQAEVQSEIREFAAALRTLRSVGESEPMVKEQDIVVARPHPWISDILATAIPLTAVLIAILAFRWWQGGGSLKWVLLSGLTLAGAGLVLVATRFSSWANGLRGFWGDSGGALIAACVAAGVFLPLFISDVQQIVQARRDALKVQRTGLERQAVSLAVASLEAYRETGRFPQLSGATTANVVSQEVSPQEATYSLRIPDSRRTLITRVGNSRGSVHWKRSTGDGPARIHIFIGTVRELKERSVTIEPADAAPSTFVVSPAEIEGLGVGDEVIAITGVDNAQALEIVPFKSLEASTGAAEIAALNMRRLAKTAGQQAAAERQR
jgi:hypothetical protein